MRRTRATYHYAIRQVRKDKTHIIRERIACVLINDPSSDFWNEIKKIRNNKASNSRIVDGCTAEMSISQLFAQKYCKLFNSVPYDSDDLQNIISVIDSQLDGESNSFDYIISTSDILIAIDKLNPHKNDGSRGLTSDHFIHANRDLSVHIACFSLVFLYIVLCLKIFYVVPLFRYQRKAVALQPTARTIVE